MKAKRCLTILVSVTFCVNPLQSSSIVAAEPRAEPTRAETLAEEFRNPASKIVMVVAHRGNWRNAPENSVSAILAAAKSGVDMVEIDVRKTKDGRLVLMHDTTVNRMTNGKGKVSEMTLAEVKRLRLKFRGNVTDEQVPTLEEAMLAAKGKILVNLDSKGVPLAELGKVLKDTGTSTQALIKSGGSLDRISKELTGLPEGVMFMPILNKPAKQDFAAFAKTLAGKVVGIEFCFGDVESPFASKEVIAKCKAMGARPWVNTLWGSLCGDKADDRKFKDAESNWGWVIDRGYTIIQTDRPKQLLAYLRERKLHD